MRVKRYVANSMQEAIALVKADFGHEAVILHTKHFRRGGIFGLFGKHKVEVIAAVDPEVGRAGQGGKPAGNAGRDGARVSRARGAAAYGQQRAMTETAAGEDGVALAQLRRELSDLKSALLHGAPGSGQGETGNLGPLSDAFRRLRDQDVEEDQAWELIRALQQDGGIRDLSDTRWVWSRLAEAIASGISTVGPWEFEHPPHVVPLIGPTGVGKTTTIAKLAANFALLSGRSVGLITVDTYRIAAVEQLKTYAEIIGVPVEVAYTPQELRAAVERQMDKDLVLIDTAGRSQRHKMQMAELRGFLEVLHEPQTHLVLSAHTRCRELQDVIERFKAVSYRRLIMTKLDETACFGALYNAGRLTGKPLSYLTNGQNVPEDIEVADAQKIAHMILGDEP